ncbi:MAG: PCYCGC domain-containing protein [Acidobacteriota bacterium]|nr:PCYCGC domain-containing protein [Acidobacteriota bacterium]
MNRELLSVMLLLTTAAAMACTPTEKPRNSQTAETTASSLVAPSQRPSSAGSPSVNNTATTHAGHQTGQPSGDHAGHSHGAEESSPNRVPAFQTDAASLKKLPPSLSPAKFTGRQQLAYKAVGEIPKTIAQLPCYCHCDRGFGHKSLYSCFVDDHAAHCAVCVDEALLAYQMQKEEKLTPAQIRERIIAKYSEQN